MGNDQTAIGAFDGEEVIGFITVSHNIFGNTAKYVELVCFQVSEPYRGKKIGKTLFYKACEEAKRLGADKLYISAHSSKKISGAGGNRIVPGRNYRGAWTASSTGN